MTISKRLNNNFVKNWTAFWLQVLLIGFYFITCGFFLFPSNSGIQTSFYSLFAFPVLMLGLIAPIRVNIVPLLVFLALPIYLTISTSWADPSISTRPKDPEFFIKLIAILFILYYGINYLMQEKRNFLELWLKAIIWVGAISATANLGVYLFSHWQELVSATPPRLKGIFWGGDTNRVAMFYTVSILANIFNIRDCKRFGMWLSILALIPLLACILLAQTKIALAILIFMIFVMFAKNLSRGYSWRLAIPIVFLSLIGLWLLFGINTFSRIYSLSIRWDIWLSAVNQVGDNWLLGNGLNYRVNIEADGMTWGQAHNFVVDSFRFGGLLAVALILAQLFYCWHLVRAKLGQSTVNAFLVSWLVSGVLASLVYSQQPFTRPSYTWFYYWIPIGLIFVSCYTKPIIKQNQQAADSHNRLPSSNTEKS